MLHTHVSMSFKCKLDDIALVWCRFRSECVSAHSVHVSHNVCTLFLISSTKSDQNMNNDFLLWTDDSRVFRSHCNIKINRLSFAPHKHPFNVSATVRGIISLRSTWCCLWYHWRKVNWSLLTKALCHIIFSSASFQLTILNCLGKSFKQTRCVWMFGLPQLFSIALFALKVFRRSFRSFFILSKRKRSKNNDNLVRIESLYTNTLYLSFNSISMRSKRIENIEIKEKHRQKALAQRWIDKIENERKQHNKEVTRLHCLAGEKEQHEVNANQ